MKKIFFLLLFICSATFGQMPRFTEKNNIGGRDLWCIRYMAKIPSNNWVVWLPGLGELGPSDGSQISKVELYSGTTPVTWTAQAKNGFEFPFNILAVQLPTGWDYWALKDSIGSFMKRKYKANEIIVGGYSLGGRGAWACLQGDSKGVLNGIFSVCGFYDVTLTKGDYSVLRTVPAYGVHGDQDNIIMPYLYDVATAKAYNTPDRPQQTINGVKQPPYYLVTIPGAGHAVWPNAFDVTPGNDGLLQWVIQQFGPAQTIDDPVVKTDFDGTNIILTTQSGKKISVKPTAIN